MNEAELYNLTVPFITEKTICIGISRTFLGSASQMPVTMKRVLWRLKVKFPKLKVVMGGQYDPLANTEYPIDKHFVGYGEDTFLKWCQEQKRGVSFPNSGFDIKTLEHRFIPDDIILPGEALPIELGRGCIFKCKFCAYSLTGKEKGSYLRHHQYLIDEMKYNKEMFGTNKYLFVDDTVNEDYDKVRRFADFEKNLGFPISWVGYCRADLIWAKPESAEWLRDSGLVSPQFGIETFHQKAAQFIGKGWSGKKAKDWLPKLYYDLWQEQINIRMNLIVGLPYEPVETVKDSIQWWKEVQIGSVWFTSLKLNPMKPKLIGDNRSDLSKDAEALGFTFSDLDENGDWNWSSPWGDSRSAKLFVSVGNNAVRQHCRVSVWDLMAASNLQYTLHEAKSLVGISTPDHKNERLKALKSRYLTQFSKHFSLSNLITDSGTL